MLVVTRRRGPERLRFGDDVRGLDIENLELHPEDIESMLKVGERELKNNLYDILCCMERSEGYREHRRHPSRDRMYTARDYREQYEQGWSHTSDACSYVPREIFGNAPTVRIEDEIANLPEPDDSGLVWTDEE